MTITGLAADPKRLVVGYQFCAATEGKSASAISIVAQSVHYFQRFLGTQPGSLAMTDVTHRDIRAYIFHLQQMRCFASHPLIHTKERGLSGHTINCYLRSLRIFYNWLVSEEIMQSNPFDKVKIPRPPVKVIPAFSASQVEQLLHAINTKTAAGYRNFVIFLTLLDTGLRISELCGLQMENLYMEDGLVKVRGKGNRERLVPIGKQVQRALWHYIDRCRPDPATVHDNLVFLTQTGRMVTKATIQKKMAEYGRKAGLVGVRCSPHTLRHTAAVNFLRNGGDVFSLQKILGHASLEMTRRYCALADVDVKRVHTMASPADNLNFALVRGGGSRPRGTEAPSRFQGDNSGGRDWHTPKPDTGGHIQGLASRQARIG